MLCNAPFPKLKQLRTKKLKHMNFVSEGALKTLRHCVTEWNGGRG